MSTIKKLLKIYKSSLLLVFVIQFQNLYSQKFSIINFDERNGLNRNYINDICRDSNGYYWLATENGLVRFDGNNFNTFPSSERNDNNSEIRKIHLYKNNLYLIYENKGCKIFNTDNYTVATISEESIDDLIQTNDSTIFFTFGSFVVQKVTHNHRISVKKSFFAIPKSYNFKNNSLIKWGNEIALIIPSIKIIFYNDLSLRESKSIFIDSIDLHKIYGIFKNKLIFSGNNTIYQIDKFKNITSHTDILSKRNSKYTDWQSTNEHTGYFILNNSKLFFYNDKVVNPITFKEQNNFELKKIYIQDSSHILIGTNSGLLYLHKINNGNFSFEEVSRPIKDRLRIRRKILSWENNKLLLLGHPYNYIYDKNGRVSQLFSKISSSFDAEIIGNNLYIATEDKGIQKFNATNGISNNFTKKYLPNNRKHYFILFNRKDSLLVSAFNDTILTYSFKYNIFKSYKPSSTGKSIKIIRYDSVYNEYWVGTKNGFYKLNSRFQLIQKTINFPNLLQENEINDFLLDVNGTAIWIAHNFGITKINKTDCALIDSIPSNQFRNPKVVSLLQDNQGRIWMGTYAGIVAYDPATKGIIKLGKQNNILNTEFNFASACKINNNKFVFGGLTGYDVINPELYPINKNLPLGIVTGYEIRKENSTHFYEYNYKSSYNKSIEFNVETESLRILLGSKETLASQTYTFQYKLNHGSWSSSSNLPYITISTIQPGHYKMEIKAFDEFGTPVTFEPVSIYASVAFYKSKAFLIVLTLIALFAMVSILILIKRNQKRENKLKEEISMDLHDEVGTLLARALLVSQTSNFKDKNSHLNNYLSEALYRLRVYINTMNTEKIAVQQLATEIKEMLHLSFAPLNFTYAFEEFLPKAVFISSSKFRSIKLCLFEILNNMIRHSGGTHMDVCLKIENEILEIITSDNGTLTNTLSLVNKGNGIKNLKKRTMNHKGGIIFAISGAGSGLTTKIRLPL